MGVSRAAPIATLQNTPPISNIAPTVVNPAEHRRVLIRVHARGAIEIVLEGRRDDQRFFQVLSSKYHVSPIFTVPVEHAVGLPAEVRT